MPKSVQALWLVWIWAQRRSESIRNSFPFQTWILPDVAIFLFSFKKRSPVLSLVHQQVNPASHFFSKSLLYIYMPIRVKDIVSLIAEYRKHESPDSTTSSPFFLPFPLPYGGGLLTDGVTTPENSRAATTSRWGGNQTLSDVYSNCLT